MKTFATLTSAILIAALLFAPVARATDPTSAGTQKPSAMPGMDMKAAPTKASAVGTVVALDATASTITISHGPVAALKWPPMTMTFKTGTVDVHTLKRGDHVDFEFVSTGMDGTLTKIARK